MIGTRLAHYEITSHLGRGGMGEVYLARDTKLKRDVAIKVLPAEFSRDPERVARAQREAEVLASLNHPHIAQIYGQEDANGSRCLVLEFVDGETLQERSRRGPIPTQEALEFALQIAEALGAAHERGIVHRDLKPGNVKITPDGHIKVLDFGLAKVLEASGVEDLSQSPTMLASGTVGGTILGTAAYMAPEQAKGKTADARSDIWAFGVVLYEMLTGQPAFSGETMVEILSSVLKTDPDWTALPSATPATVRALLRRCLQKDRNRRVHAIADARIEIEEALKEPAALEQTSPRESGEGHTSTPFVAKRGPLWKLVISGLAAVVLASVVTGIAVWNFRSPPPLAITRFPLALGENQQFTFTIGSRQLVSISPDGSQMVYMTSLGPYLRSMKDFEATPIRGLDANVMNPVFSPDGRSIAFYSISDRSLKKMSLGGGAPVSLGQIDLPFGLNWDDDGILFGWGNKGIVRVSLDGKRKQVVTVKDDEFVYGPQMLPDGQHILFTLATGTSPDLWDRAQIVVQSLKSGARTVLLEGGSDARYVPTDHLVYALGGILFAAPFDPQSLRIGSGVPVVEGVRRATAGTAAAHFSVSNTGSLIYIPGPVSMSGGQQELAFLENGTVSTVKLPPAPYETPRISPNGKQVAYGINNGKEADIYIYDLYGTTSPQRITFGGRNRFPIWSDDGLRIAFQSDREGDFGIFWQRADGNGTAEQLTKPDKGISHVPESWLPKGDKFSFSETNGSSASLLIYSLKDRKAEHFGELREKALNPFNSAFSPDGRWIAYTLRGPSAASVFVQPFPATGRIIEISKGDIGHHPLWSREGTELYYFPGANPLYVVSVMTQSGFSKTDPVPVRGGFASNTTPELPRNHDVTLGGKIIFVVPAGQRPTGLPVTLPEIRVVLNWFEDLKARVGN